MRDLLLAVVLLSSGLAGCLGTVESPTDASRPSDPSLAPINRSIEGLSDSQPAERVELAEGDTFELTASYVKHDPGTGHPIRMMAYNGQVPGPELHLEEGTSAEIAFTNELDEATTVHWHGLRHANAFDGVPGLTQDTVEPGESFTYEIEVPDAGVFWYHPHVRTDVQKELGLYGALIVHPSEEDEGAQPVPEQTVVHLDDIRLEGGDVPEMYEEVVTYADAGRWGNQPFVDGTQAQQVDVAPGERHRLHLVNPANARTWRLDFQGFEQVEKIAAGASYLEQPREIETLALGPAERATVDVQVGADRSGRIVDEPTTWTLVDVVPTSDPDGLDGLLVQQAPEGPHQAAREEDRGAFLSSEPDHEIRLVMERDESVPPNASGGAGDGHGDHDHAAPEPAQGEVDPRPTSRELDWWLVDADTGELQPTYEFEVGDVVRFDIEIVHEHAAGGDHAAHVPIPHTIHLHGQRFLVEDHGGETPPERAWRDTVRANDPVEGYQTTSILVEVSNPGTWLIHCHVSEHGEIGMTATVDVTEPAN